MNIPLRYALIGCGRIAPNHIAAYMNNRAELTLCAVCDPIPERMEAVLSPLPEEEKAQVRRYTDYRDMLAQEQPQLCAIATESGKHAAIGMDVIAAGSNLIIEKPISLSIKDAKALIAAAKEKGVKLCACHQNRFNKSIQKIRSAVEENRFGKMLHGAAHIRWNRSLPYYQQAPWRGTWAQDGGALMNQCIHNIDLLRWMMGDEATEVMAYTDNLCHDFIEAEDLGLALVRFAGGSYGLIEGTTNIYPHNLEETLYLFGTEGTVKAGGKSVNIIEEWEFKQDCGDPALIKQQYGENPPNVYGFGHTPLYADVIAAIREDRAPYVDGEAGLRALETVLAIYKSAAEHRPVQLPLEDCSTMDFVGRFDR
ncbi:MAG: Gfo/Idh/MocA family oxidoreductase [Clostridiales bacterium]|nr:Gfo/Idh/MocA family oxidoreductase [Clostridiales bacterium]